MLDLIDSIEGEVDRGSEGFSIARTIMVKRCKMGIKLAWSSLELEVKEKLNLGFLGFSS